MNKFTQLLVATALLGLTGSAFAIPISGTINIGGQATVQDDGTNSTGINFIGGAVNTWPAPTGTFSGLGGIDTSSGLTLYDFLYTEIPSKTIWEIDSDNDGVADFSFTLTSVSVTSGDSGNFSNLVLNGAGMFSAAGYDDTYGSWTYSQSGASFSSESVPEPAIIALFGLGLIGVGLVGRRGRKEHKTA